MMYLLEGSRRPRLLRPARFEVRGGRADRRRYARWRRFPSDCRIETHSNMRIGLLCRNFSGGTLASRSLRTREIRNSHRDRAEGEAREQARAGRAEWLTTERIGFQPSPIEFEYTWNDNLPWAITAGGGGCMSYETITVFSLVPFSNDTVLDALDTACTRPPARTPDRPSSTR
jgi:hypothetical protein